MESVITSLQNPLVKKVSLLIDKPRARREMNLIVIEGIREISLACKAGLQVTELLICEDIYESAKADNLELKTIEAKKITRISKYVFEKIAYRSGSGGVIALAIPKIFSLENLVLNLNPLLLVLETVEKPGNLGAILRTADAAGVDAVIICDPQTDIYNPNTIRSSLGCLFTRQVVVAGTTETIEWMKKNGIKTFGTALSAANFYHYADFTQPAAIIMGSEALGLSSCWLANVDHLVKIPMLGKVDSMNVSASAAIVVFEALRQRGFIPPAGSPRPDGVILS